MGVSGQGAVLKKSEELSKLDESYLCELIKTGWEVESKGRILKTNPAAISMIASELLEARREILKLRSDIKLIIDGPRYTSHSGMRTEIGRDLYSVVNGLLSEEDTISKRDAELERLRAIIVEARAVCDNDPDHTVWVMKVLDDL